MEKSISKTELIITSNDRISINDQNKSHLTDNTTESIPNDQVFSKYI